MTDMTPDRLAELRAVAEAATEGPWESSVTLDEEGYTERVEVGAGTWIESGGANYRSADLIFETDTYGWDEDDCNQAADNARHVRTFDPPTVLSLIAALEVEAAGVDWLSAIGKGLLRQRNEAWDAIERLREAATEVTNQGNNHGRTHYDNCWKQHLHCLAAKIIHETGDDDE